MLRDKILRTTPLELRHHAMMSFHNVGYVARVKNSINPTLLYSYGTRNDASGLLNNYRAGVKILTSNPSLGKTITKAVLTLRKTGLPTGIAQIQIRDGSDAVKTTLGTQDVSALTTSFATYSYENLSASYVLSANDRIGIEIPSSGSDASNQLEIGWRSPDLSGENQKFYTHNGSSYTDQNGVCTVDIYGY